MDLCTHKNAYMPLFQKWNL